MPQKLKLIWEELGINEELEVFKLFDRFPNLDKSVYCGKFNQLVSIEGVEVEVIHFTDLIIQTGDFMFFFMDYLRSGFNASNYDNLTFTVIEPILEPLFPRFKITISSGNDLIFAHIFLEGIDKSINYISSLSEPAKQLKRKLKDIMTTSQISIDSYISFGNGSKTVKIEDFMKKNLKYGNFFKFSNIILSSEIEKHFGYKEKQFVISKALKPFQPLIRACSELIPSRPSDVIATICRRLIGICFNGGLALNLIDYLKQLIPEDQYKGVPLPTLDAFIAKFTGPAINPEEFDELEQFLKVPLYNLEQYVSKNDSEAQFRAMFWDPVLINLFHGHAINLKEQLPKIDFALMSEWNIRTLFPELEARKVDFAALWSGIPLLITEMGNEEFDLGVNSHKDFAKSLGLISQSCRKLALKLEAQGRGAENAKIFGIWIGGTQIHFITGRAIVSISESGEFTIHCNCYFPREWKFNVLQHQLTTVEASATVETAEATVETYVAAIRSPLSKHTSHHPSFYLPPESPVTVPATPIRISDIGPMLELEDVAVADEKDVINLQSDEETPAEQEESIEDRQRHKLVGDIEPRTLVMLDRFIAEMMDYIKSIPEMKSTVLPRKFRDPEQVGFIPKSRASTNVATPLAERLRKANEQGTASSLQAGANKKIRKADLDFYDDLYTSEGRSTDELNIFRKFLSQNPGAFPKLVEYFDSEESEGLFDLVFEAMDPLIQDRWDVTVLSKHMFYDSSAVALLKALKFAIEILNSLDLLHSAFGLVHSDISPNNIMFSLEFGVWKLIDFGNSMDIALSASVPRVAGTSEYIAPESLETGIFTVASDVFALGRVIEDVLYYKMAYKFESRSRKNDLLFALFRKFEKNLYEMLNPNPIDRISVRDGLLEFYGILLKFPAKSFDPDQAVYLRVGALYEELVDLEQKIEQAVISAKKSKVELSENIVKSGEP